MAGSLNISPKIVLIASDLRSTHNVGSLFRTAEGLGVDELILCGYTPYPKAISDKRLPHLRNKLDSQINKTALGAQNYLAWRHHSDLKTVIDGYRKDGYLIVGLEQDPSSLSLRDFKAPAKLVLLVGNELNGLDKETRRYCNRLVEIPMLGHKESYNVVQAAAMALYHLRFGT